MSASDANSDQNQEGRPPIFRSWDQLYAFVLILHAFIILLFYLFTKYYS